MNLASLSEQRRALRIDIVSVQSQVVYGRVGNNAAVPTLEAQGFAVAAVPTVVFSNIPSYPTVHGGALPVEWFGGYLRDLSARGALDGLRAIQCGYLGNPAQAAELERWLRGLLAERAGLRIVIDPVMGDEEHGIYGAAGMADAYRDSLAALANGLTPNGFELGCLTGQPVETLAAVVAAARNLLVGRTEWVVVTSAAPAACRPGEMRVMVVTATQAHVITHPRLDTALAGTGDMFSAALTGHWLKGDSVQDAAVRACQHVVHALRRTELAHSRELLLPLPGARQGEEGVRIQKLASDGPIAASSKFTTRTSS